jgi:hypothetical protein
MTMGSCLAGMWFLKIGPAAVIINLEKEVNEFLSYFPHIMNDLL